MDLRQKYIGTSYDALSLCYNEIVQQKSEDEVEQGIDWYKDMIDNFP